MTAIQILKQLHCEEVRRKHPGLPDAAVTSADYTDRTANGLTKCVVKYVTLLGGFATRVTTTGQMRPTGKTEVSAGQMKWVYGTTRRGTPDIMGVLNGKQLAVEVKIGKDRLSPAQIEVGKQINAGGGYYFIARDFESVYEWINNVIMQNQ
jgi:hypothetical protein